MELNDVKVPVTATTSQGGDSSPADVNEVEVGTVRMGQAGLKRTLTARHIQVRTILNLSYYELMTWSPDDCYWL